MANTTILQIPKTQTTLDPTSVFYGVTTTGGSPTDTQIPKAVLMAVAQMGAGASVRQITDKLNDFYSVKDYGAIGNTVLSGGSYLSGNNDTTAIQDALTEAAANGGGTVFLPPGTYYVTNSLNLGNNTTLYGCGATIFYGKPAFSFQHCILMNGVNHTRVLDVTILSDPNFVRGDTGFGICVQGTSDDTLIQGCSLTSIASAGIWVTAATNVRVIGNRVNATKADGIHFSDGTIGGSMIGNIVSGSNDDALAVVLDTVGATQPSKIVISNNVVTDTVNGHGVVFIGCGDVVISNNSLTGSHGSLIGNYQWNADTRMATNIVISGNMLSQSNPPPINNSELTGHGILIGFAQQVTITGNLISDIPTNTPYVTAGICLYAYNNVFIRGNTFQNIVNHGVYVVNDTAASSLTGLWVEHNNFFNVENYGVLANPTTAFLNNVHVNHNNFKDVAYIGVSNLVSLGRTQTTPLTYCGNVQVNGPAPLLDNTNASNIVAINNTQGDVGNRTFPGTVTATGGIVGVSNGGNAASGIVGEYISATAGPLACTSGSTVNFNSIALTAGDWDVSGTINFPAVSGVTVSSIVIGVNNVSATRGGYAQETVLQFSSTNLSQTAPTPTVRISVSSGTTAYLVGQVVFSGGSLNYNSSIRARRVR